MELDLIENFLIGHYELKLITDDKDLESVQEIRRNALSKRYNMSETELKQKGYLSNEDDNRAFIYLIRHLSSQRPIGTVRVCFVNDKTPTKKLPLEQDFSIQLAHNFTKQLPLAEVSRFALVQDLPNHKTYSVLQQRIVLISLLMVAIRINSLLYPTRYLFALMEPSLHRILRREDVPFTPISEAIEFYGKRIPYVLDTQEMLRNTHQRGDRLTQHYLKALCHDADRIARFIDRHPYLDRDETRLDALCRQFRTR